MSKLDDGRVYFTNDECDRAMTRAIAENGGKVYNGCMGAGLRMIYGDIGHDGEIGFYHYPNGRKDKPAAMEIS
jgi:hypothetical protein